VGTERQLRDGLGIALNESRFVDVHVDARRAEVRVLLHVLTLPETGPEPKDPRRVLRCWGVSRVTASLRNAPLADPEAPAEPLALGDLSKAVRSFGGLPIYGWEFVDPPLSWTDRWAARRSLDELLGGSSSDGHRLYLFQDAEDRCLELCVWFEDLTVTDGKARAVPLDEFLAGGKRWWDALFAGDPRVGGHGIVAASRPETGTGKGAVRDADRKEWA
jgi:hypothetical protein